MATNKNAAADAAKATYTVTSPLLHGVLVNGKAVLTAYEVGETVELTDAEAAPLLAHTVKPAKG